jgi:hypothetical protein
LSSWLTGRVRARPVAKLQLEFEETDGRAKGRIRRNLDKLEMQATRLEMTLEMSQDAEKALWAELWSTAPGGVVGGVVRVP